MSLSPYDPAAPALIGALIPPDPIRGAAMMMYDPDRPSGEVENVYRFAPDADGFENLAHDERLALLAVSIAGQQAAGFRLYLDLRQFPCPTCGASGFNSGWGYVRFTCGAEVTNGEDGDFTEPCGAQVPV